MWQFADSLQAAQKQSTDRSHTVCSVVGGCSVRVGDSVNCGSSGVVGVRACSVRNGGCDSVGSGGGVMGVRAVGNSCVRDRSRRMGRDKKAFPPLSSHPSSKPGTRSSSFSL